MNLNNVLLVYKKSIYQIYFLEKKYQKSSQKIFSVADQERLKKSHCSHQNTLHLVRKSLLAEGVKFREIYRARHIDARPYDFVIAVGGDGTFLEASKRITSQPILGVNSDPERSVGNFLACTGKTFEEYLKLILNDKAKENKLHRMQLTLDGEPLNFHVLNDILIAHHHPAAMSRYILEINGVKESQRGSGIWVSTAAGSSGAIMAAGGKKMPRGSKRVQYLPRELFHGNHAHYKLTGGIISLRETVIIESQMREGVIYIDGPHLRIPFSYGRELEIKNSRFPLHVVSARDR